MKVAVINFSGNPGKTTLVDNLLAPRIKATRYEVETINAGNEQREDTERITGDDFGDLQEDLMQLESAIVDVGASNAEEFVKQMSQFYGSHEEFDFFVVPVVSEGKQQTDTVKTIKTLAGMGVQPEKIRVVFRSDDFVDLQEDLMQLESAIVDVGASNAEEFVKQMSQFYGSHEEFDFFVVPVVSEGKQQTDTVKTIKTLAGMGVQPEKIRVVFNKVNLKKAADVSRLFSIMFGFHEAEKLFTLQPGAVVYENEIYDRLRRLNKNVSEIVADETDYRAMLREAKSDDEKETAISMISAKRLAMSAHKNLDDVFDTLFK